MTNLVKNGIFAQGLTHWTGGIVPGSSGVLLSQHTPLEGSPYPGAVFMPEGNFLRQQFNAPQGGEYELRWHSKTPQPGSEPGEFAATVRVVATSDAYSKVLNLPYGTDEWQMDSNTVIVPAGLVEVEFETGALRGGVLVDSVSLEFLESDFCAPIIRELQSRRDDLLFQKHPEERYRQIVANAINQAPDTLWVPATVELSLIEGTQQYGLYHLPGLRYPEQVTRVWFKYSTGQIRETGRWECIPDAAGVYIFFDRVIQEDCIARVEYRPEPQYDCSFPEQIPIDHQYVAAAAWELLLAETGNDVEPEARRITDYQIAQLQTAEMAIRKEIRTAHTKARTTPAAAFTGIGLECAKPEIAPPYAAFVAAPVVGGRPLEVRFTNTSSGDVDTYQWAFGDGFTSTEANPVHTYQTNGEFFPVLTVTGPGGQSSSSIQIVRVGVPQADFHAPADQLTGPAPHRVDFVNDTDETGIDNITYKWTFNYGAEFPTTSTEKNPSYTFPNAGSYSVLLEAQGPTDKTQLLRSKYIVVTEAIPGPEVVISGVPITVEEETTVNLSVTLQHVASWEWDIGDGVWQYPNQLLVQHFYDTVGTFTVRVRATGTNGSVVIVTGGDVTVVALASPIADFQANKTTVVVGEVVVFDNLSQNAINYAWDFDLDNPGTKTSTEFEPEVSWDTPGTYDIELVASDNGNSDPETKYDYITVEAAPEPERVAGSTVQYYMNEVSGATLYDSGDGTALNLGIQGVYSRGSDWVTFSGGYAISAANATKVQTAIAASNEFTLEAWIKPATADPASAMVKRILLHGPSQTNASFDLHQVGDRIRVDITDSVVSQERFTFNAGLLANPANPYHLVVTRDTSGTVTFWLNNSATVDPTQQTGNLAGWTNGLLSMAGRFDGSRVWDGEIWLGAIYPFAFSAAQVEQNYNAGPGGGVEPPINGNGPPTGEDGVTVVDWYFKRDEFRVPGSYDRYVDPAGDDSDGLTPATAWQTLAKMNQEVQPGNRVWVAAGAYSGEIKPVANGSDGNEIEIMGGDGVTPGQVTITPSQDASAIDIAGKSHVHVRNFNVTWPTNYGSNWITAASSVDCCIRNVSVNSGQTAEQAWTNRAVCAGRGCITYGSIRLWLDNVTIKGARIGFSHGKVSLHNYNSYCTADAIGHQTVTYNDDSSNGFYTGGPYLGSMHYRCFYGIAWKADNLQAVGTDLLNKIQWRGVILRECVFQEGGENALDLKNSEHWVVTDCLFMGVIGSSEGWVTPDFDSRGVITVGNQSDKTRFPSYHHIIRRSIFWDNTQAMNLVGNWRYVGNLVKDNNRSYQGGNQAIEDGNRVGTCAWRQVTRTGPQMMINNIVVGQNQAEGSIDDAGQNLTIDGNRYYDNGGGDGVGFAIVGGDWPSSTNNLATWRSTLASRGAQGVVSTGAPEGDSKDDEDPDLACANRGDLYDVVDYKTLDFRPNSGSPVIGAAVAVTKTANSGGSSDTLIELEDVVPFTDGFGIMDADRIRINGQARVRITSVDYANNRITIDNTPGITWGPGMRVDYDYDDADGGPTIGPLVTTSTEWWKLV